MNDGATVEATKGANGMFDVINGGARSYRGHHLHQRAGGWLATPEWLGRVDFDDEFQAAHAAILRADSEGALKAEIDQRADARSVEYIGWYPAFELFGDCGNHPQFGHLEKPPAGWRFRWSGPLARRNDGLIWASSLDEVIDALRARPGFAVPPDDDGREQPLAYGWRGGRFDIVRVAGRYEVREVRDDDDPGFGAAPQLAAQNHENSGYNIIAFGARFYGLHQSEGPFDPARVQRGLYARPVYVGVDLDAVKAGIVAGLRQAETGEPPPAGATAPSTPQIIAHGAFSSLDAALAELARLSNDPSLLGEPRSPVVMFAGLFGAPYDILRYGRHYVGVPEGLRHLTVPAEAPAPGWLGRAARFWRKLRPCAALIPLFLRALKYGASPRDMAAFTYSRSPFSQGMLQRRADLVFIPSVPFFYGQQPWVIEIEDSISLCFPFLSNGRTQDEGFKRNRFYPFLRAMLESSRCRGVVTHVRSTAETLPTMFGSPELARKVHYVPMGVKLPDLVPRRAPEDQINLLFTSSWHQQDVGFYVRGGVDMLCAFREIARRHPQVHLVFRSPLPQGQPARLLDQITEETGGRVRRLSGFIPGSEWRQMMCDADIFLLPSARIHVVSILESMGYGLPLVVSDGWGIDDYVEDGRTGVVVPGRRGVVTWVNHETGMLCENYEPMHRPNEAVIERMVEAIERLVVDRDLRRGLGAAARQEVATRFTIDNWNEGLRRCFDAAV